MARVSPEQAATKWAQRLSASTDDIKNGVQRVTEAPGVAAARQKGVWLAKIQASADKWARRVASVSLADWQNAMTQKGLSRIASGAQAAEPKMASFMSEFLPYVDQGVQKVRAMPKTSVEDGIARAAEMIRHNARFQRRG